MKNTLKFIVPSLIGILLFVTPISYNGAITIPVAIMANLLLELINPIVVTLIYLIICISTIPALIHKLFPIKFIKENAYLTKLFEVNWFWLIIRIIAFITSTIVFFNLDIPSINNPDTGIMVMIDLIPLLLCMFVLASFLLPLLLDYGLLDFFGTLLTKIMRPIFNLPGRAALDCIASWLGDGTIGVILTAKQYEEGYYTKKEATTIATTFSFVSITFCLVVISEVNLESYFVPFYMTVLIAGIIAAIIVPRLFPLNKVSDEYIDHHQPQEDKVEGSLIKRGYKLAIETASDGPNLKYLLVEGTKNMFDMWISIIPCIMAMGTVTLVISVYTPFFDYLGMPFIPLYELLQVPFAKEASSTVIVGFADMFLPSVIASSIESELTRFVVACTSVTQLIYMSEIGSVIMGSTIKVSPFKLFIIFLERTIVTLPIIAIIAHLIF